MAAPASLDALLDEAFTAGTAAEQAAATTSRLQREHHRCLGGASCVAAAHHASIAASAQASWDSYYHSVDLFLRSLSLLPDEAANEVVRANVSKMMDSAMRMAAIKAQYSSGGAVEVPVKARAAETPTKTTPIEIPSLAAAAPTRGAAGAPSPQRSIAAAASVMDAAEMNEATRKLVSQELLETERTYISNLRTYRDVFGSKLRPAEGSTSAVSAPVAVGQMTDAVSRGDSRAVFAHGMDIARGVLQFIAPSKPTSAEAALAPDEYDLLFSFVDELLPFHQMFCRALEIALTSWSATSGAGEVLLKYAPFLRMYKRVCASHEARHAVVMAHIEGTEGFTALLSQLVTSSACAGQSMDSYLIMPVQRLTRLRLLAETLLKHTAVTHADHARLTAALVVIKEVVEDVNTDVARAEAQSRVSDICYRFFPPRTELVQPHRLFVKEGGLEQITPTGTRVPVVIILFSDMYVLAAVHAVRVGVLADMLAYTDATPLFGAEHSAEDDARLAACGVPGGFPFSVLGTRFSFTFIADSEAGRAEWMEAINRVAEGERRKAMSRSVRVAPVNVRRAASDGTLDAHALHHAELTSSVSLPTMASEPLTVVTAMHPSRGPEATVTRASMSGMVLDAFDDAPAEALVRDARHGPGPDLHHVTTVQQSPPAPVHVLDSASNDCMRCGTAFTMVKRKHHCRACGFLVCHDCSTSVMKLPSHAKPQRVCDFCVAGMHSAAQRSRGSVTSTRGVSFAATPQHATPSSVASSVSSGSTSARTPGGSDGVHAVVAPGLRVTSPVVEEAPHEHASEDTAHVCEDSDPSPSVEVAAAAPNEVDELVAAMPQAPVEPVQAAATSEVVTEPAVISVQPVAVAATE